MTAAGGTISLLVGALLLRLAFTDTYQSYVRVEFGPLLAVAGIAVIGLAVATLLYTSRDARTDGADDNGHDHDHSVGVGWLLLTPIAALLLVAPPTLGSYGVDRGATVDVKAGARFFDPLDRTAAPVAMTLLEFAQRAYDHGGASFNETPVQLTGFVAGADDRGFRLARYQIACCAADAAPLVVRIVGTSGDPPPRDEWVTITGLFQPGGTQLPELAATTTVVIEPPRDPYE